MPILIRRIAAAITDVVPHVPRPIRVKRDRFLKENELERYVDLAARRSGLGGAVLIVLDADDDCPPGLAASILERATHARSDRLIQVVLARREYEAWFLAAADSIAGLQRPPRRHHAACRRRVDTERERVADLAHAAGPILQGDPRSARTDQSIRSRRGETWGAVIRQDVAHRDAVATAEFVTSTAGRGEGKDAAQGARQRGGATRCVVSVSMLTEGWDARTVTPHSRRACVRHPATVRAGGGPRPAPPVLRSERGGPVQRRVRRRARYSRSTSPPSRCPPGSRSRGRRLR